MANDYFDTTSSQLGLLVEDAYNLEVDWNYREAPLFSQIATRKAMHPSMNSDVVVFTLLSDLPAATTPLDEVVDPDAQTPVTPTRVSVTFAEYGAWSILTQRLQLSAFVAPDPTIVRQIANQMVDSIDLVAKATVDTGTHFLRLGASSVASSTAARNTVAGPLTGKSIDIAATILGENLVPTLGGSYVAYAHPRVILDIREESGANAWLAPQVYNNTQSLYSGEVGEWMGIKFIKNIRATKFAAAGASSADVYSTYVFGADAICELIKEPPHVVLSNKIVDPLERKTAIGWKANLGYGLYRDRNLVRIESTATLAGTVT